MKYKVSREQELIEDGLTFLVTCDYILIMEYIYNSINRKSVVDVFVMEIVRMSAQLLVKLTVFYIMYVWLELYRETKINI